MFSHLISSVRLCFSKRRSQKLAGKDDPRCVETPIKYCGPTSSSTLLEPQHSCERITWANCLNKTFHWVYKCDSCQWNEQWIPTLVNTTNIFQMFWPSIQFFKVIFLTGWTLSCDCYSNNGILNQTQCFKRWSKYCHCNGDSCVDFHLNKSGLCSYIQWLSSQNTYCVWLPR